MHNFNKPININQAVQLIELQEYYSHEKQRFSSSDLQRISMHKLLSKHGYQKAKAIAYSAGNHKAFGEASKKYYKVKSRNKY